MEYKLENVILEIEKRRQKLLLLDNENIDQARIDYLNSFFEKYSGKRVTSLANLQPTELLLAYLLEQNPNESFENLESQLSEVSDYIEDLSADTFELLGNISLNISEDNLEQINKLIMTNKSVSNLFVVKKKLETIFSDYKIKLSKYNLEDIIYFIKSIILLNKIKIEEYLIFTSFIISLKSSNEISDFFDSIFGCGDDELSYTEFKLKEMCNRKKIEEVLDPLYKYYLSLEKQQNKSMKEKNKQIYRYTELLEILKREDSKEEITCIDLILDKIKEEDLKVLCLKYVEQHNKVYYQKLEEEYIYRCENSISKYVNYFSELGIDFKLLSNEEQQMVIRDSLSILIEKVNVLGNVFKNSEVCVHIAIRSQLSVIKDIDELLKKGYVSQELLLDNYSLYYDEIIFNNLKANIEFLLKEKVNLISVVDKCFLLTDNYLLIQNFNILKSLDVNVKSLKELKMLFEINLQEKINSLIEVGLEQIVLNSPDILNSDINLAKRIVIARLIGDDVLENDMIKESILDKDKFFVADDMINNYLFDRDNSNYQNSSILEFKSVSETKGSYLLEGVIIPKARVTNLCVSLEALIKPSLYSKEEVKVLEKYKKVDK